VLDRWAKHEPTFSARGEIFAAAGVVHVEDRPRVVLERFHQPRRIEALLVGAGVPGLLLLRFSACDFFPAFEVTGGNVLTWKNTRITHNILDFGGITGVECASSKQPSPKNNLKNHVFSDT
jgi:hypothetical protein